MSCWYYFWARHMCVCPSPKCSSSIASLPTNFGQDHRCENAELFFCGNYKCLVVAVVGMPACHASSHCRLHMAENSFTRTTYVSPFKANTSANWNAVSRQIWRGCHTSVDGGDLNQAPPKQSAVCSTCIIPALPVNCQFIWMACAFGMSATQPILE